MLPSHKWYIASVVLSVCGVIASIRGDVHHRREKKADKTWDAATGESNHIPVTADKNEHVSERG